MKRILSFILILLLLLPMLISCLRPAKKRPADFVDGDEIVIDNETPFIYDESKLYDDTAKIKLSNGETAEISPDSFLDFVTSYKEFIHYYGNKIVRHYKTDCAEYYYTIYSLANYKLLYLYLKPLEGGDFEIDAFNSDALDSTHEAVQDVMFKKDAPHQLLGDNLPDYKKLSYYSQEEVAQRTEKIWSSFEELAFYGGMGSYLEIAKDTNLIESHFYRCLQLVTFDAPNSDGIYCYDLIIHQDQTGTLYFKHASLHNYENGKPICTLNQEAVIELTSAETDILKNVIDAANLPNAPTWQPDRLITLDGESTYILDVSNAHLIYRDNASSREATSQIRTAIEDIVRERIEVTSGRIYTN